MTVSLFQQTKTPQNTERHATFLKWHQLRILQSSETIFFSFLIKYVTTTYPSSCVLHILVVRSQQNILWMASPTQWTWVWVNSGSWQWTGRPGVLQSMGGKESDTTERLNWTENILRTFTGRHCGWHLYPREFSRQEYRSGFPRPPPGVLPNPGIEPKSPVLQADSLPSQTPGKPKSTAVGSLSLLQWIFPTQESNRGLLHYRRFLYQRSYQGSPGLTLKPINRIKYNKLHTMCENASTTYFSLKRFSFHPQEPSFGSTKHWFPSTVI